MSKALKAKTDEIKNLLMTDNAMLEMAVVAIYRYQTESEKASKHTNRDNGVGFASCDANNGSYYATYIQKGLDQYGKTWGQNLSGKHLEKARKFMPKYSGQLAKIELAKDDAEKAKEQVPPAVSANEGHESEWELYEQMTADIEAGQL